jgi:DNA-binding transcriptional ArsR family regulator
VGLKEKVVRNTLQIATYGEEDQDMVLLGVKYLPITKLILITVEAERDKALKFASKLGKTLKIETEVYSIKPPILYNTLAVFREIVVKNREAFEDIVVNVSSGDKQLGCAALTSAFINGLKTMAVDGDTPVLLPIIKLSYDEVISETKMNILKALDKAGGSVSDLTELASITGYGKPLLSYHINGAEDSKGLVQLGLVEVKKYRKGRLGITITPLGRMLLASILG